ncbi:Uncharacterised protein [Burkholderia pseudomallei]|nr:putative membrane protein [Burkholderia pseudomallei Pasteur 52237]VBQ81307.1 Uncharacterised protein [Burkholderia pseudomallei]
MTAAIAQFERRHPVLFGIVGALLLAAVLIAASI